MRTRLLRYIALAAVPVLLLTACPEDDEPEVADEPDPDVEEPDEEEEPDDDDVERGDGVLRLGYILPESGPLAFLGPPQINAVEMAVDEINEAGGVLGNDIELSSGDEAGDTAIAAETAERLLGEGVDAIIGAAASGMSLAFIDQVTGSGVVQCSGSNTGPIFTDYDDDGYYFRTAPTDALQGPVLAERILGDGHSQIAIAARGDEYGEGLLDATVADLEAGGAEVVDEVIYDPEAATFDSEVEQISAANPDAVALIAFDEGAQFLQAMIEAGLGPDEIGVFGADGLADADLPELVEPGNPNILDGMQGTRPDTSVDPGFAERLQEFAGEDDLETTFAPQAFDCTVMVALAAVAAESDHPEDIRDNMLDVANDGEECSTFEECVQLLEEGEEIDYKGPSGATDWIDVGEPEIGFYEVYSFADGEFDVAESGIESTLE